MTERPILFSGPMVRAILSGQKTQTRRVVKPQPPASVTLMDTYHHPKDDTHYCVWGWNGKEIVEDSDRVFPYGQPGDRLWVRESICLHNHFAFPLGPKSMFTGTGERVWSYAADNYGGHTQTRPSIHMPRWASRITLEITAVRVERLQQITNNDAQAEGVEFAAPHRHGIYGIDVEELPGKVIADPYAEYHNTGINDCWICSFRVLWESINGPGSWALNPWVWVIEFRRVK